MLTNLSVKTRSFDMPSNANMEVLGFLFSVLVLVTGSSSQQVVADGFCREPIVDSPGGILRGTTMTSRNGRHIYAFLGLRYALPPTGDLRFKAPLPANENWRGVRNATEDGPACPQLVEFFNGPTSEDCLFLNVYTTKIPHASSIISMPSERNRLHPVIVYFHPGGFFVWSGSSNSSGPQYLLDEDIVLVSVNYRLGALGFLSTGDSESPGNYGLKDQVQALKWVRENIAHFGGDPDLVTLYGYSAGGASAQYHMLSPRSAGLFHRAISSSGSCLSGWAFNKDPLPLAKRQAALLNCPSSTSKEIVDCLRTKDANEIAQSYLSLREWQYDPIDIYNPVVEPENSSDNPFLTADPEDLLRKGNFTNVPWLTGSTDNEMIGRAYEILGNETLLEDLNRNFENIAPIALYYERNTPLSRQISKRIKQFYFGNEDITNNSTQEIANMYQDSFFLHGVDSSVKLVSSASKEPVYYYQFSYRGRFGHLPIREGMGVPHHDDLIYLIYEPKLFPLFTNEYPEAIVSKRMVKMWANFARTGNPTPGGAAERDGRLLSTTWLPHTPSGLAYLEIGPELKMKDSLWQDRAEFWSSIMHMSADKMKG